MKDLGSTQSYSFEYDSEKLRTTSKSSLNFTDTFFSDIEELEGIDIENEEVLRYYLKEHIENGLEYFQRIVTIKGFGNEITVRLFQNEINFEHITTGQWQESLEQCFVGWSEQEEEESVKWFLLKESIKELLEDCLIDYIKDFEDKGEFSLEDINFSFIKQITVKEFINLYSDDFIDTNVCTDEIEEAQLVEIVELDFLKNTVFGYEAKISGTFKILKPFDF